MSFSVARVDGRWQPLHNGEIVHTSIVNRDRTGYATREGAEEALARYAAIHWTETRSRQGEAWEQYYAAAEFVAKTFEKSKWKGIAAESDNSILWMLKSTYPLAQYLIMEDPEAFVDQIKRTAYAIAMKEIDAGDPDERPIGGGLSDDVNHLNSLVRNEATDNLVESGDATKESAKEAQATPELIDLAGEFDYEVWRAIIEIVKTTPPKNQATPVELWEVEAPTYIFMTLGGEGTGIWDTMWEDSFEAKDKPAIERFLKKQLGKYADIASGGSLQWAIRNAAYETTEGPEPTKGLRPL